MKRFYRCPIVGQGTADDPYRAAMADLAINHVALIVTGKLGHPASPYAVVLAAAPDNSTAWGRIDPESGITELTPHEALLLTRELDPEADLASMDVEA